MHKLGTGDNETGQKRILAHALLRCLWHVLMSLTTLSAIIPSKKKQFSGWAQTVSKIGDYPKGMEKSQLQAGATQQLERRD